MARLINNLPMPIGAERIRDNLPMISYTGGYNVDGYDFQSGIMNYTKVDVYEKILYDMGRLYGIPVLNGNDFSHNINNSMILDFTHFTAQGCETVGKRLAAPFIAGDLSNYVAIQHGGMVGVRPQEDSLNVYGNACIEYTDKTPGAHYLIDNNDLYDKTVNRVAKGLAVYMNYPLNGTIKDLYDKTLLDKMELTQLNNILTTVWSKSTASGKDDAVKQILEAQNNYVFNESTNINVGFRQADLYARGKGVRGSEEYKKAYTERITFLQGKHGYEDNKTGKVTWAFYCDKDGTVVIPSLYGENAKVQVELDFASILPEKAGYYLTLKELDALKQEATENEISLTGSETKEELIAKIKAKKGYDRPASKQSSPSDICDWTDSDVLNPTYVEPSTCEISLNGYYNRRKVNSKSDPVIKVVSKGWHTITLSSKDNDKFLAFGLQFMDLEGYKAKIK